MCLSIFDCFLPIIDTFSANSGSCGELSLEQPVHAGGFVCIFYQCSRFKLWRKLRSSQGYILCKIVWRGGGAGVLWWRVKKIKN